MKMWLAQTAASGMVPWLTWLGGQPRDTRWQQPAREIYQWLALNEKHFYNRRSLATVGLVWPQRTQTWHPQLAGSTDALQGYYFALIENRVPFDLIHDTDLTTERLAGYNTVVLPNAALLSEACSKALAQFVAGGGNLVATFESSLYDEWGKKRADFDLSAAFGVHAAGATEGPLENSYMQVRRRHALLAGLEGTTFLPGSINRQPVSGEPDAVLERIPGYPAFPPEMVYPRSDKTGGPELVLREAAGRVVYFPGDIDRTLWRTWNPDLSRLLANAVRWAARGEIAADVRGPGLLDVFYWQTESGLALHLLNYTNPAFMHGPAREPYPVGEQKVTLSLPDGFRAKRVSSLETPGEVSFQQTGGRLTCNPRGVVAYEVLAIEG